MDERRFCVLDVDPCRRRTTHTSPAFVRNSMLAGGKPCSTTCSSTISPTSTCGPCLRPKRYVSRRCCRWHPMNGGCSTSSWRAVGFRSMTPGRRSFPKTRYHQDYCHALGKLGIERKSSETELGMFIAKHLPGVETVRRTWTQQAWLGLDTVQPSACRAAFDKATGASHPWPEAD